MAVRVLSQVWDGYPGGGSELLALLALADWSDDEGRCWPSIAAIAKKTRLSRSQTQRTVHALIESGYVIVTGNETGGAPGTTRQYRINLKALTSSAHATPTGSTHATGSVGATGSTHTQEGSHPCTETGSTHATQTVSEPSVHVKHIPRAIKTSISADFQISERVKAWAAKKGFYSLEEHLESFKAKCSANGYAYVDHDSAFMEAIREDWAKLRKAQNGNRQPSQDNFAGREYGKGGRL